MCPAPPEIQKTIEALRTEPDRSAAIVGTAIIEASLEQCLIGHLHAPPRTLIGQLFNNRGPLSDLHSKLLVAEAFGVVTPAMASEMHSIKAIRNVFAHAKVPVSFETKEIAAEITTFVAMKAVYRSAKEGGRPTPKFDNKGAFLFEVQLLYVLLSRPRQYAIRVPDDIYEEVRERMANMSK